MNKILDLLIQDMQKHGDHTSWDWDADARFAEIVGDAEAKEMINLASESAVVSHHRFAVVKSTGITQKRLRALRQLQKEGFVRAYWVGMGPGGRNEWGVGRVRGYELIMPRT